MKKTILCLATLAFLVGGASLGAQPTADLNPDAQEQQPELQQRAQDQEKMKTFTGTISRSGNQLVLEDTKTKIAYQLDDQEKVKQYEGKKVKVTGTLDVASNTIRVRSIEAAA